MPRHVVEVVPTPPEREDPERRAESGHQAGGHQPPQGLSTGTQSKGNQRRHQGEERHQQMAQSGQRKYGGCRSAAPTGLHTPNQEAQVHEAGRHGERVGEFARHGRHQVPAHDVERLVEQEREGGHGGERGTRERESGQSTGGPPGHRHDHQTGHGDPLDGHAVVDRHDEDHQRCQQAQPYRPARQAVSVDQHPGGQQDGQHHGQQRGGQAHVDGHHHQHRHHHVEVVGGESGVPVRCPSGQAKPGQQLVTEERRPPHVGAEVTAGGG